MRDSYEIFEAKMKLFIDNHATHRRMNRNISQKLSVFALNSSVRITSNKLKFTYDDWKRLDELQYIKERRQEVHYFINHLIKEKIIHPDSDPFPKNLRLHSINTLTGCFLNTHLPHLDATLALRAKIMEKLDAGLNEEYENYIYLYLYLFSNRALNHFQFSHMNNQNYFCINEKLYFVLPLNLGSNEKELGYDIVDLDPYISGRIKSYLDSFDGDNLFAHSNLFSKTKEEYAAFMLRTIKTHDGNLNIKIIKNAIQLDTQLTYSPFTATVSSWNIYPKQTLVELDRLHPGTVPKVFLDKEIALSKHKKRPISTQGSDIFDNIEEELEKDDYALELIRKLSKLRTNPKHGFKQKISVIGNQLRRTIPYSNSDSIEHKIAAYIIEKIHKVLDNQLAPQTFKSNLSLLNTHVFLPALYSKSLSNDLLMQLQYNILHNDELQNSTKSKYIQILNHFFTFSYDTKLDTAIARSYQHRSLIFDDEFEILIDAVIKHDTQQYHIKRMGDSNFYRSHVRAVFLILLRYCGARKNELRSRLPSDWYLTDNGYALDINKDGFKKMLHLSKKESHKGLKNRAARRRVTFSIENARFQKLVERFFSICEKMGKKFIFCEVDEKGIYSRPVSESTINELNLLMQETLKREVVLHSLRHSFITYRVAKILADNQTNTQNEIFELCNMTGQSDPVVMMNNYLHIDHLEYLTQYYKKDHSNI